MTSAPLRLGLSLSPTWLRGNAWRRTDSRVEDLYSGDFHLDVARMAEAAGIDFLFKPDVLTLRTELVEASAGFSSLDPTLLMAALAPETERIGLVTTISATLTPPYLIARQLQSLHRLSNGRAGWNIVMSMDGHGAFGQSEMAPSENRYARAQAVVDAVRALWGSYPAGAVIADRAAGRYADVGRLRPVDGVGPDRNISGTISVPAHDSPIPLFQAGGSPRGVSFAGATADAVFTMASTVEDAAGQRAALHAAATAADRKSTAVRSLPGFSFVLCRTRAEAETLANESEGTGPRGANHWSVVGTPHDAVESIRRWATADAIDGLIALPLGSWGSLELFLEEVVPGLRDLGLVADGPGGTTLAERIGLDPTG